MKRVAQVLLLGGVILLLATIVLAFLTYGFLNGAAPMAILVGITGSLGLPLTLVGGALLIANGVIGRSEQNRADGKEETETGDRIG